jgi:hypothetical protein
VLGHAGYWKELDNVLTQHERQLGSDTLNGLKSANAGYLEYLYGAVGHAASLSYFVQSQELGVLPEADSPLLKSLRNMMALYGRYDDLTILDENGFALYSVSRDLIQSHVHEDAQKPHFLFEELQSRSIESAYVSQMMPNQEQGVVVSPVTPVVFVAIPIEQTRGLDGAKYLVIKGFAGRYLQPYLEDVARDFDSVSFKLSFPGAP